MLPYTPLAERAWQLRHNFTAYDAAYISLAEMLDASVITLDARIAGAAGPRCSIIAYTQGATPHEAAGD